MTKKSIPAKHVEDVMIMTENFFISREDRKENRILFINSVGGNVAFRGTTLFLKPYQDASVEFTTGKDLLHLFINFHPAVGGGKEMLYEKIVGKLASEGFVYGLKEDVLRSSAVKCQADETPIMNVLCAEGDGPVDGEESKLRLFFKTTADMVLGEDINIDFQKRDTIPYIGKNIVAAEIIYPTKGRDGKNIKGNLIPAKDGILHAPKLGANIREENGRYFTNIEGWPIYKDNTLNVLPYFETAGNVDYSTGNISFPGTVMVRGDVLPGFTVVAKKGDLIVKGNVTDARLKASGNIIVSGGAKKADIQCDGDLTVKFIEHSKARAKGDIIILGSAIANYLLAGGDITMLKGKGTVIAGKTLAAGTIAVLNAGNDVSIETIMMAGEDFFTRNKMTRITKMMNEMTEQKNGFQLTLQKIGTPTSNAGPEQIAALKAKIELWTHQIARLERIKQKCDELIGQAHATERGKIIVKKTIFHGSIVSLKNAVIKIHSDQKAVEYTFSREFNKIMVEKMTAQKADSQKSGQKPSQL